MRGLLFLCFFFGFEISSPSYAALGSPEYASFVQQQNWTAEEELGYWLFSDPRLSGDNSLSCKSCHIPEKGWSDGRARAIGFSQTELPLRTPTLIGLEWQEEQFGHSFFWDGRARTLFAQALMPVSNPLEMNQDLDELVMELEALSGYKTRFQEVYGAEGISLRTIALAIVAFEKTLKSPSRRQFDSGFVDSLDGDAEQKKAFQGQNLLSVMDRLNHGIISDREVQPVDTGKFLFERHCATCHRPESNLSDGLFHDIGLKTTDIGRASHFNKASNDFSYRAQMFKHKTPTLWGVAQRKGPYMHNGSLKTLRDVLEHYNEGVRFNSRQERVARSLTLSPLIGPFGLSDEDLDALEEFITTEFYVEFVKYPEPPLPGFAQSSF